MNVIVVLLDIVAVNAAYYIALYARFYGYSNLSELFQQKLTVWAHFAPFYTVICLVVFYLFHLYNGMWEYAGMHDFNRILFASVTTSIIHTAATWLFMERMPLTYYCLGAILQFVFLCGIRLGYRILLMEPRIASLIVPFFPAYQIMCCHILRIAIISSALI